MLNKKIAEIQELVTGGSFEQVQVIWIKRKFIEVAHAAASVKEVHEFIHLQESKWFLVRKHIVEGHDRFASYFHRPLSYYDPTSVWEFVR